MFEQLKSTYQSQLLRDPNKEFGPEYVRTTDLERRLVDEYGFDAIRLIYLNRGTVLHPLGEMPEYCPWAHVDNLNIQAAIDNLFAPIAVKIPSLLSVLRGRCSHLYAEEKDGFWVLHYFLDMVLYDGRQYYHVYTGGLPNTDVQPNLCLTEFDWVVPPDLTRLYAVHDGFGPILGSQDISVMAKMMDPICKEQNVYPEDYRYSDLLEFHQDGTGNAQCFYRQADTYTTVDWDHETWEISGSQDCFDYIDERLSQLDEEWVCSQLTIALTEAANPAKIEINT